MMNYNDKIETILNEDIEVTKRFNKMIETTLDNLPNNKKSHMNQPHRLKLVIVATFCTLFLSTGIVFAKDIIKFAKDIFSNTSIGVNKAIENGYIQDSNMEYIENNKIEIKIDKIIMDDYNLDIAFNIKLKDAIIKDRISNFYIYNLLITDENDNIIVAKFEDNTKYEQFCKENNIDIEYKNIAYGDGSEDSKITKKTEEYFIYSYTTHSSQFPRSKNLKITFDKIAIVGQINKNIIETIEGNWIINVDLPEEFYNRESFIYEINECNVEDIVLSKAIVSKTGMKIALETKWGNPVYNESDNEEQKNKKIKQWLNRDNLLEEISILLVDNEYVENSKGEKFFTAQSSDNDGGYTQSPDGTFIYHQTFNLTSFDSTDKLLVVLPINGELKKFLNKEEIVIELIKTQ